MAAVAAEGPMAKHIREKLSANFNPAHLEVECESQLHNVPKGVEIHFRVQIVSDKFEGLSKIQRHRLVNKCLAEELESDIHALRIQALEPKEYDGNKQDAAPKCGGGHGL
ncbi:unnamed protein product [Bursaphelenchus okinawaensis]|uniref:BolA-like protein n=1 Tax=Bursaphelenchus okinawaensis TaxID=465554 RepID=A0A811LSW8_9BILA|nr:unnamed protein product [Bursaphelenchus okinawaensis]CAG9127947.1 unnamed protein product [Bursaphelenchus okinawaensis]